MPCRRRFDGNTRSASIAGGRAAWLAALLMVVGLPASAVTLESVSPQGSVKQVRQLKLRFSEPMVAFGDPSLPAPADIDCAEPGTGRWVDSRQWVYDFERELASGLRCHVRPKAGLRSLTGHAVEGLHAVDFDTGGPAVKSVLPSDGDASIDEQQAFVLLLDAPTDAASVAQRARCAIDGVNERVGVRVLEGEARARVLSQPQLLEEQRQKLAYDARTNRLLGPDQAKDAPLSPVSPLMVLQCVRTLPNDARVSLVWGRGIRSSSGLATLADQKFGFRTRKAFEARFSCLRMNAKADCTPVGDMRLNFTAAVTRAQAEAIRLRADNGQELRPVLDDEAPEVSAVRFRPPFAEQSRYRLELPADLRDDAGRTLVNARQFPLQVKTDEVPPLAKFPASFGILERTAGALLPVTLRNLEPDVTAAALAKPAATKPGNGGGIDAHQYRPTRDEDIIAWLKKLYAMQGGRSVPLPGGKEEWHPPGTDSIFSSQDATQAFTVPKPQGARAMEVVGIPLPDPGLHIVELRSPRLGAALLEKPQPYYVQAGALVTDLAVHLKWGRESSLVWVTRLSDGQPVAEARVAVRDCSAKLLWEGATDPSGIARMGAVLPDVRDAPYCPGLDGPLYVSARSGDDMSFALASWDAGISPWQFNLRQADWNGPGIAHTVFDRSLVRAGDTVHMKHLWRRHAPTGFDLGDAAHRPDLLVIEHEGSSQRYELPLKLDAAGTAESDWTLPADARLGSYRVSYEKASADPRPHWEAGSFRVAAFRVPTMKAVIQPPGGPLVAARETRLDLLVSYLSGGGAAHLPVMLRTQLQPHVLDYPAYSEYSFNPGDVKVGVQREEENAYAYAEGWDDGEPAAPDDEQAGAVASSASIALDAAGASRHPVQGLPVSDQPRDLVAELEYADANGERQVVSTRVPLWPSRVNLGLRADGWTATPEQLHLQALALDLDGKPMAGRPVQIDLYQQRVYSHRKRLIGGFYAYEHVTEVRRIGPACEGKTDDHGVLACDVKPGASGNLILRARATDRDGHAAVSTHSIWIAGPDQQWFEVSDNDRMDLLPERKQYEPGDTAQFQVRMPFRAAHALVTVEREGVIDAYVVELKGRDPQVKIPIKPHYAPNVFVSVLALRGRAADVQPTAQVDLGKPAFRLGLAEIMVGWRAHTLDVKLETPKEEYRVRARVPLDIRVHRADGQELAPGSEVALAAVDEGLLELAPNKSWKLLEAMMQLRGIEVRTATAQMQVVGKRHFGRKAVPQGGGGGRAPTRELFDTLLAWQARVPLDARGRAHVDVPLNDTLGSFRLVAVATSGLDTFGTGSTSVRTTQELMLHSGLPPQVREGDHYEAEFTVRNASDDTLAMTVTPKLDAGDGKPRMLEARQLKLAGGAAQALSWPVDVPAGTRTLRWEVEAVSGKFRDRLAVQQQVTAVHPVEVVQASLQPLDQPLSLDVQAPAGALPGRGGLDLVLAPSLAGDVSGIRDYMNRYPYTCTEQQVSVAVALDDKTRWESITRRLPDLLDGDGLLRYFPRETLPGSDVLTSYVLSISHEAGWPLPDAVRDRMLEGLTGFVAGRINRDIGVSASDRLLRKLAALDALSRYGRVQPDMLRDITADSGLWPTSALLDWIGVLKRTPALPKQAEKLRSAQQQLRARLDLSGTRLTLSNENREGLWWLMQSADASAVRAPLAVMDERAWKPDLPRLMTGALGRRQSGHFDTTPANAWARLALDAFRRRFESTPVTGAVQAQVGARVQQLDWKQSPTGGSLHFDWPAQTTPLQVQSKGTGHPWLTLYSRAAVPHTQPVAAGYSIKRSLMPERQRQPGTWSRGDVMRVSLELDAQSDMSWVVLSDPLPAGATALGKGLARESVLLSRQDARPDAAVPTYEERAGDAYRAYFSYLPKGHWTVEYTLRLDNAGIFALPDTRVEAMYAPDVRGLLPNAPLTVAP